MDTWYEFYFSGGAAGVFWRKPESGLMEYEPTRGEYSYRFFQALEGGETVTIEFKVGGSVFFANVVQVPHYGKVEDYWKLELSEIRQVAP